jgi:TatD DNase family protein
MDECRRLPKNVEFVQHDTAHHIRAIGETGLDFFHWEDMSAEQITKVKQQQRDALVAHMRIAQTHHLPLILHVRDRNTTFEDVSPIRQHEQLSAYSEVISLLHAHWLNPNIPLVLHCFSGSATYARAAQKLGAYFSFAGNITYPTAQPLRDILHTLPPNHVLIETDAPFLPPQRHRGKSCEPAWIAETAECVCKITHMTPLQLVENARLVFEYAIRKSGTDA